jgi:hypothetical protein
MIFGPRRRSAKLFHRRRGRDRHDSTGLSTPVQLGLAAAILAPLVTPSCRSARRRSRKLNVGSAFAPGSRARTDRRSRHKTTRGRRE